MSITALPPLVATQPPTQPSTQPSLVTPVLRAARPADRHAVARLFSELSSRSSYERFFVGGFRVTDRILDTLLCVGGTGRAFVALERDRVVAHAMWATPRTDARRAEIAFVVAEDHRGHGLATRLTRLALADASEHGITTVEATVLAENRAAQRVIRRLLPQATAARSPGEITYVTTPSHGSGEPCARLGLRGCRAAPPIGDQR